MFCKKHERENYKIPERKLAETDYFWQNTSVWTNKMNVNYSSFTRLSTGKNMSDSTPFYNRLDVTKGEIMIGSQNTLGQTFVSKELLNMSNCTIKTSCSRWMRDVADEYVRDATRRHATDTQRSRPLGRCRQHRLLYYAASERTRI